MLESFASFFNMGEIKGKSCLLYPSSTGNQHQRKNSKNGKFEAGRDNVLGLCYLQPALG